MGKKKVKKKARRIATFGIVSITVIVVIGITLLSIAVELYEKQKEKMELENKLVELEEKQKELEIEVNKLGDKEYLARYAREKYFYSKDGELIIRIPEK